MLLNTFVKGTLLQLLTACAHIDIKGIHWSGSYTFERTDTSPVITTDKHRENRHVRHQPHCHIREAQGEGARCHTQLDACVYMRLRMKLSEVTTSKKLCNNNKYIDMNM